MVGYPPGGASGRGRGSAARDSPDPLRCGRSARQRPLQRVPAAWHRPSAGVCRCMTWAALAKIGGGRGNSAPPRAPLPAPDTAAGDGFVVTMEPGLYFIVQPPSQARASESWAARINRPRRWKTCWYFGGIRIEDDLGRHRIRLREPDAGRLRGHTDYYFASRSRISVSNTASPLLGGGATAGVGGARALQGIDGLDHHEDHERDDQEFQEWSGQSRHI